MKQVTKKEFINQYNRTEFLGGGTQVYTVTYHPINCETVLDKDILKVGDKVKNAQFVDEFGNNMGRDVTVSEILRRTIGYDDRIEVNITDLK